MSASNNGRPSDSTASESSAQRAESPAPDARDEEIREPQQTDVTDIAGHQRAQNDDANSHFDPTLGHRPDQRRRNDKQGRMGG